MEINLDRYLPLNTREQIDALVESSLKKLILYDSSVELEVMMAIKKKNMQIYFKDKVKMEKEAFLSPKKSSKSSNKKNQSVAKSNNDENKVKKKEVVKKKRIRKKEAEKLIVQGLVASLTRDENIPLDVYKKEYDKALKQAVHYNLKDYFITELKFKRLLQGKGMTLFKEKPLKENLKEKQNNKFSEAFKLDWKDVYFQNGKYTFMPRIENVFLKSLTVKDSMILESYNYIRGYFKHKLPEVTWQYNISTKEIKIINGIKFKNAILMIAQEYKQAIIEKREISNIRQNNQSASTLQAALSKAKQMTAADFRKYKSKFIDFLISKQLDKFLVVPISEAFEYKNNSHTEDAFLFSIEADVDSVTVVLENVNPDRSTLIFEVLRNGYMNALNAIYIFIQGGSINKRSEIRSHQINFKDHGIIRYRSVNHDDFYTWKFGVLRYNR